MAEYISDELQREAYLLGLNLARPNQEIVSAVEGLNINLATIGCDPVVDADEVIGTWRQSTVLTQGTPPFSRALRSATSSIIWRPENLADTIPPIGSTAVDGNPNAVWVDGDSIDLEEAARQSSEGAVWIDPEASERRATFAERNSAILKCVLGGLAAQGFYNRKAKPVMREEFDEILDGLWQRGSYHCFVDTKVIASMMRKAGMHTPASTLKTFRRFQGFGKDYGYGLAMQRLLPESVLLELE